MQYNCEKKLDYIKKGMGELLRLSEMFYNLFSHQLQTNTAQKAKHW